MIDQKQAILDEIEKLFCEINKVHPDHTINMKYLDENRRKIGSLISNTINFCDSNDLLDTWTKYFLLQAIIELQANISSKKDTTLWIMSSLSYIKKAIVEENKHSKLSPQKQKSVEETDKDVLINKLKSALGNFT